MSAFVIPLIILTVAFVGLIKRTDVYDAFCVGAKNGARTTFAVFPCLVAIFIMLELMRASGVTSAIAGLLSPVFSVLGIPSEITELIVLRPLSGSGSIAVFEGIVARYGADSYVARCAGVIMGGSETVLYVTAIYFSKSKAKKTGIAVPVSIISSLLASVLACALMRML